MAKFRSKTKKKRFGLSGGKHSADRKKKYAISHRYRYHVKPSKKSMPSCKLIVFRQNMLRKYSITKARRQGINRELFVKDNKDIYCMKRVSLEAPFQFKISRVSPLSTDGYRLVHLEMLQKHVSEMTVHALNCDGIKHLKDNSQPIKIVRELRTQGLATILIAVCQGCKKEFQFTSSPQLKIGTSHHFDVNMRAVWGSMVTGGGVARLNEAMATFNAPGMSQQTFSKIEQEIGDMWGQVVLDDLLEAGAEERRIAIEKGNYHQGVPCISVVCDGGWCKRSHKHSYNALGGVAIIIGAETGKLLYVGVRNKYCYICNRAETEHQSPKPHTCFKNWSESSQAMESDIILEGFLKAEKMHGLRFTGMIADGDSSTYAKIQEQVPVWGKDVTKYECANHVCKCLRSNLEKLVTDNPMYKGRNKLSKALRVRLTSAVRCAIRMRSKEDNHTLAVQKLDHDIRNSIHHILGCHDNCSDFCKRRTGETTSKDNIDGDEVNKPTEDCDDSVPSILGDAAELWSETTSLQSQEESRCATTSPIDIDAMMIADIKRILDRVASKSSRLLGNVTTNLAESWMAIRAKFDGGKLYNRCNKGSWQSRCLGGCLRKNFGSEWSPTVWQKTTASTPGHYFTKLYRRRYTTLATSKRCKAKPEMKARRWKHKHQGLKEANTKKARQEYGPDAVDDRLDLTPEKLQEKKDHFLQTTINITEDKITAIEKCTTSQSSSAVWREERKNRLTSSNFGRIVKRNPGIPVKNLVKDLLHSTFTGNRHTTRGLNDETMSIKEYITRKAEENEHVEVTQVGLCICRNNKFLAASPDGKITSGDGGHGLLEIKNLLHSKPMNLFEGAREVSNFCLEMYRNSLRLKQTHNYFYQVQGQLNITNTPWADFVVRTTNPYQLHVERIYIDRDLWETTMVPKLKAFYHLVYLPELVAPMFGSISGIREPGQWFEKTPRVRRSAKKRQHKELSLSPPPATRASKQPGGDSSPQNLDAVRPDNQRPCVRQSERTKRKVKLKFLGRRISHQWIIDEVTDEKAWYTGTVCDVLSGTDGDPSAVYEVLYDGDEEPYSVDHLYEDYHSSSVKLIDM